MATGTLQLNRITEGLSLKRVGRRVELHDRVASTNRLAWDRAGDRDCDGLVICAEHQSEGRGRLGRSWESPCGASILMSAVLRATRDPGSCHAVSLLAAIAAVDAISGATSLSAEIKWPNDLILNGRKLGGILVESRPRADHPVGALNQTTRTFVVGIGINCLQHRNHFPPELRASATSLDLECAEPVNRDLVARHLLIELDRRLNGFPSWEPEALREAWIRRATPLHGPVRLRENGQEFRGHVIDVDPTGGLVVQLDVGGRRLFDSSRTSVIG